MTDKLRTIEWHDLPLESILISENGITFYLQPFDEATQNYYQAKLELFNAESFAFDIVGHEPKLHLGMEINSFECEEIDAERITGKIGILTASGGWWGFRFVGACWRLVRAC